jgi:hypothetical protein
MEQLETVRNGSRITSVDLNHRLKSHGVNEIAPCLRFAPLERGGIFVSREFYKHYAPTGRARPFGARASLPTQQGRRFEGGASSGFFNPLLPSAPALVMSQCLERFDPAGSERWNQTCHQRGHKQQQEHRAKRTNIDSRDAKQRDLHCSPNQKSADESY